MTHKSAASRPSARTPHIWRAGQGGATLDLAVYPVAAHSTAFRSGQTPEMTPAPHGASCAGFPFAPGVFRGLFVICLICNFNAPVRRFNSGRCAYIAAAPRALCALFMALWRGIAPRRAFPLCGVLPACRHRAPPLALGGVSGPCGAGADWFGLSAWSLHAGRGFWWGRGAPPKSPEKSPGKSRKSLA